MTDEDGLNHEVEVVLDAARRSIDISPAWVATEVLTRLGFTPAGQDRLRYPLVYAGCHLAVRQIARGKLRRHDPVAMAQDALTQQGDIFPETLQERYPRKPEQNVEPVYALRDHLSATDLRYNIDRLRNVGRACLKHADALEAWQAHRGMAA